MFGVYSSYAFNTYWFIYIYVCVCVCVCTTKFNIMKRRILRTFSVFMSLMWSPQQTSFTYS
jgi:hypothetical protein